MKKAGANFIEGLQYNEPSGGGRKYTGRDLHEDRIEFNKPKKRRPKKYPKKGFTKYFKFDGMVIHAKSGDIRTTTVVGMGKVRNRYGNDIEVTYTRDLGDGEIVEVRNNNFLPMNATWIFKDGSWQMVNGILNKRDIADSGAKEAFYENMGTGVSSDVRFVVNPNGRVNEIWL